MAEDVDDPIEAVIAACSDVLRYNRALTEARRARDRAIVAMHRLGGYPKTGARSGACVLGERLTSAGWSPAEVEVVGVSEASIRQVLDRSRRAP